MSSDNQKSVDQGSPMAAWVESATDYWASTVQTWSAMLPAPNTPSGANGGKKPRQAPSMVWNVLSSMAYPSPLESFLKEASEFPDPALRMLGTGYEGCSQLNRQLLKLFQETGRACLAGKLVEDQHSNWLHSYENWIQAFLKVPESGLNHVLQERMNRALDEFNVYQQVMSEFTQLLRLLVKESSKMMEEKFQQFKKEGALPENIAGYYSLCVRMLEGHYTALLKSPAYLQSLCRTLSTVQDLKIAQHKLLTDFLQTLPIPTNKDMDEVYKEIYTLKKRVNELTKKKASQESTVANATPENQ